MGFLKKAIRNLTSRTAPVEAVAAPAGPVARVLRTAPVEVAAPMGRSGRGILGNVRRAVQEVRPAFKGSTLPKAVGRILNKGFGFKDGGSVKASRSVVSSGRGDGAAIRGKTKCKMY